MTSEYVCLLSHWWKENIKICCKAFWEVEEMGKLKKKKRLSHRKHAKIWGWTFSWCVINIATTTNHLACAATMFCLFCLFFHLHEGHVQTIKWMKRLLKKKRVIAIWWWWAGGTASGCRGCCLLPLWREILRCWTLWPSTLSLCPLCLLIGASCRALWTQTSHSLLMMS